MAFITPPKTENLYSGEATDGRQGNAATKTSRFRPVYRNLTPEEKQLHDDIKAQAVVLEELFNKVKDGRYKSLGYTALEEAVMWTVKELTS